MFGVRDSENLLVNTTSGKHPQSSLRVSDSMLAGVFG